MATKSDSSAFSSSSSPKNCFSRKFNAECRNGEPLQDNIDKSKASSGRHQDVSLRCLSATSSDLIPEFSQKKENEFQSPTAYALLRKTQNRASKRASNTNGYIHKCLFFISNFVLRIIMCILRYIICIPLSIAAPSFWLSVVLWIFWKIIRFPMNLLRWLTSEDTGTTESFRQASQRTILISCGSSIQTLHLARNFYSAGARVIVFEFDDLFGLARFSTAVDKFYQVPRPSPNNTSNYIDAICHIVRKERPSVYVPVCATSPAYYDALAKPYLELLGCASFIPGVQETAVLDDCLQFFLKCSSREIQLPPHSLLRSWDDLLHLHASGFFGYFRNILVAVGMQGLLERHKYILREQSREFKFEHEINERHQWLVVRDVPGDHYITCTTVKDSRVVANVVCRIDHETKILVPVVTLGNAKKKQSTENLEIEKWIKIFFAKVRFQRSINGHFSFRMVRCQSSGRFLPLGIRVGVSLPYICHTYYHHLHARTLSHTMKCIQMQDGGTRKQDKLAGEVKWCWSCLDTNDGIGLDKRGALFAYWDPLPYCAFYHFQLPLESVKLFLRKRHRRVKNSSISPRITI